MIKRLDLYPNGYIFTDVSSLHHKFISGQIYADMHSLIVATSPDQTCNNHSIRKAQNHAGLYAIIQNSTRLDLSRKTFRTSSRIASHYREKWPGFFHIRTDEPVKNTVTKQLRQIQAYCLFLSSTQEITT